MHQKVEGRDIYDMNKVRPYCSDEVLCEENAAIEQTTARVLTNLLFRARCAFALVSQVLSHIKTRAGDLRDISKMKPDAWIAAHQGQTLHRNVARTG